ncbi:MAG TPA: hypothetical protein VFQ82_07835 [Stellaceae bacterium]|jgi:carbonic anhydrase|nr:hypothetical protein [Stellaceae bacterium]
MTPSCQCHAAPLGRRHFLLAAGLAAAFPSLARAQTQYDAMLLSCIDPRIVAPVYKYMDGRQLTGRYSQFVIAGAAIGVVAPKFKGWHQTFWDNLGASFQLHQINRVIAIDHRDCGAARIAYGADSISTPERETATHRKVFEIFRAEMKKRHPDMAVETGLMALDGTLQPLG